MHDTMKKTTIILVVLLSVLSQVRADTIDFWHVYHHGHKIGAFNANINNKLNLPASQIGQRDTVTVSYFRDTGCSECPTRIEAIDEFGKSAATAYGHGNFNPLSVPLQPLKDAPSAYFDFYYYEGREPWIKQFLFRLYVR
jgi:hypothetical protein